MRILLITAICLSLAACGGETSDNVQGEDTPVTPDSDTTSDTGGGDRVGAEDGGDGVPTTPGSLKVTFTYCGAVPVQDIQIALLTEPASCEDFDPVASWDGIEVQKAVPGLDSFVTFQTLTKEKWYTLYATARTPDGDLSAAGCVDWIFVQPGEMGTTEVTLELYPLLLDARGAYTVTHRLDLDGDSYAPADALIAEVATLFDDPSGSLYEKVRTIALVNSGFEEASPEFMAFSSSLQIAIDGWFDAQTPACLDALIAGGAGLGAALDGIVLTADLDLGGSEGEVQLSGTWAWTDLALPWPGGCIPGDAGCETLHFGLTELVASDYPVYLSTDLFSATVTNFDQLAVETHGLSLSLGGLALYLVHEVLLPTVNGPADILDLATGFADCAAIVAAMSPSAITGINMDAAIIEGMCQSAVNSLAGDLEDAVENLQLDSELKVKGICTLADDDDDLDVDALIDGQWDGDVFVDGEESVPFVGTFAS